MKNRGFLLLVILTSTIWAQNIQEIVNKIDRNERFQSSYSKGKQIIITSSGKKRTLEFESWTADENNKQLTVYLNPRRVRGDKILMRNDGNDIWFYTPKTDRVRHLAKHARRQRVQGSDFAYEDISGGKLNDDFTARLIGEEEINGIKCFKIELIPTESGPHYQKLILWADKQRYVTIKIDYYQNNEVIKQLWMEEIRQQNGHWIPFRMVMKNLAEGGQTEMITEEFKINLKIDPALFTTRSLKNN